MPKRRTLTRVLVVLTHGPLLRASCAPPEGVPPLTDPLAGAWEVVERSYVRGDSSWAEREPGPYLFTGGHYAVQEIREAGGPRAPFTPATDAAERLAAYEVFHAHAGRYAIDGDRLLVTPTVAKGPNTMLGDTYAYELTVEGDRMRAVRVSAAEDERRETVLRRVR